MAWLDSTVEDAFSRQSMSHWRPMQIACLMIRQVIPSVPESSQSHPDNGRRWPVADTLAGTGLDGMVPGKMWVF